VTGLERSPAGTIPVTVVIPAHDRAATIARAVRTAFEQQPHAPAEVIVIDDCSADDTARVAREAGARVIRHETNRGAGAARNTGVANATQPWIALLDSDDEWLPNHLAALWPNRDGHVLLSGAAIHRTPDGDHGYVGTATTRGRVVRSPLAIAGLSFFAASGVMVRRDVMLEAGGFRALYGVEDIDLWLRMLERGTAYASPVVSVIYHLHGDQVSGDSARMEAGHRAVLDSYRTRPWFRSRALHRWDAVVAWDAARGARRAGDRRTAARHMAAAVVPPARGVELVRVVATGRRRERRTSRFAATGAPTLAVVGDEVPAALSAASEAGGFAVVRPAGSTRSARWLTLCRRPTTAVLVDDAFDRAAARVLGIRALRQR
jgi:GT2 family glycosyltransferase